MKLLIDNREPKEIIEHLKSKVSEVELLNLDIGDYHILDDSGNVILILERKSLSDLISSIKDGRYAEQSLRLSEYPIDNNKKYYLLEGNTLDFINKNNDTLCKMLFSSILSLSYYKGFNILKCVEWLESCEFIIRFFNKLEKSKSDNKSGGTKVTNYQDVIKSNKKSNITSENINQIMLAQIPGVSSNIAESIILEFGTVKKLVDRLEKDNQCLDNFKISAKNQTRKLSKNVIANIKELLLEKDKINIE